jgi:cellulose synthase/poly-beta-1,6-N-acetylglucosamine synthase-like glycosyltransferase
MFSTDKVYAVEVSQANDILSKGYNIYRLIDYRGRIYTRVPETIREWGKQRIRWSENSLIYAIQENKKSLIKFSILFLLSLYLVFFPFLILIHISFFFIGLYLLLYLYLNKIRKVVFSKIVYKKYFKKLSFLFYVKIFLFTYIEIILNIYTTIELLIFGGKKLKARKNLDYEINY